MNNYLPTNNYLNKIVINNYNIVFVNLKIQIPNYKL